MNLPFFFNPSCSSIHEVVFLESKHPLHMAINAFVSEIRHAKHTLCFFSCVSKSFFNILRYGVDFLYSRTARGESHRAAKWIYSHSGFKCKHGQTDGALVVPLSSQALCLLLLLNALQCLKKNSTEKTRNLLHLWLILCQNLTKPAKKKEPRLREPGSGIRDH